MEITKPEPAFKGLMYYLDKRGFQTKTTKPINKGRYRIFYGKETILVAFKTEWFNAFSKIFWDQGARGQGDSINVEDLKYALKEGVTTIYTIKPNGMAHKISMKKFMEKSIKWRTKEGKEVRSVGVDDFEEVIEI